MTAPIIGKCFFSALLTRFDLASSFSTAFLFFVANLLLLWLMILATNGLVGLGLRDDEISSVLLYFLHSTHSFPSSSFPHLVQRTHVLWQKEHTNLLVFSRWLIKSLLFLLFFSFFFFFFQKFFV